MFGMGWPELIVIAVVALIVFGPDRLPGMARQAAHLLRTIKQMASQATEDLKSEIGDDWQDLDPRRVIRDSIDGTTSAKSEPAKAPTTLPTGSMRAPYDDEAT